MDPISDMINRIKNAQAVGHEHVVIPFSNVKLQIATVLNDAGYVSAVERTTKKAKRAELDYLDVTPSTMMAKVLSREYALSVAPVATCTSRPARLSQFARATVQQSFQPPRES